MPKVLWPSWYLSGVADIFEQEDPTAVLADQVVVDTGVETGLGIVGGKPGMIEESAEAEEEICSNSW